MRKVLFEKLCVEQPHMIQSQPVFRSDSKSSRQCFEKDKVVFFIVWCLETEALCCVHWTYTISILFVVLLDYPQPRRSTGRTNLPDQLFPRLLNIDY